MFENVGAVDLLSTLSRHDFDSPDNDLGAEEIDALGAYDRLIRAA